MEKKNSSGKTYSVWVLNEIKLTKRKRKKKRNWKEKKTYLTEPINTIWLN